MKQTEDAYASYSNIAPAGILDPEDVLARKYRGMNPEFVKRVWAKRKAGTGPSAVWPPEKKAEVLRLIHEGQTYGQMAMKMGVSRNAISGVIHSTPCLREAVERRRAA